MTLYEYIKKEGAMSLAMKLNCTPHAIRSWARGERLPSVERILEIERLSKGKVKALRLLKMKRKV